LLGQVSQLEHETGVSYEDSRNLLMPKYISLIDIIGLAIKG